jgi:gliding motility-associated-like protein
MKKISLLTALFGLVLPVVHAQKPLNDDCAGAIKLGTAPTCPATVYSNVNATNSFIGNDSNNPVCFTGSTAQRDVWFTFICPDTLVDFRILLTATGSTPIRNAQFALYRGECKVDELGEIACVPAGIGQFEVFMDALGLTKGAEYFIRVSDFSLSNAPNWGNFSICVDKIPLPLTIKDGGSKKCSGTLYDSGGPDGDYGPKEDHTFTICPEQPSACLTFGLEFFNIENDSPDQLIFYDGKDVKSPVIAALGGASQENAGGAVCYTVRAESGCMTLRFKSDNNNQFEGWKGRWTCSVEDCPPAEKLTTNAGISAQTIENTLGTNFSKVTVKNMNCSDGAFAAFDLPVDNNSLGLKKGLLLTTGNASLAKGPNDLEDEGLPLAGVSGDSDLNFMSLEQGNLQLSFDACVIEMEVFANTDELNFEYVFGSEEYPEWVGDEFNDIFAFFISGPGITGNPLIGNKQNIALLPGKNEPVQISSVNDQTNWQFYRNNTEGQTLQYDGMTSDLMGIKKSLTARSKVTPCNTYKLKLAIADRADRNFDSGVFVSEIGGNAPKEKIEFANGIDYFIEKCAAAQDVFTITLAEAPPTATTYTVRIGGTAQLGVDYALNIPPTITFAAGQTKLSYPITPLIDNLGEGRETITVELLRDFGCGAVVVESFGTRISDNVEVDITGGDTLRVCLGKSLQLEATGATDYSWAPADAVSNPLSATPFITPTKDMWLSVRGSVGDCFDVDSVFIDVVDVKVEAQALGSSVFCVGDSVRLNAVNNVNNEGLIWTPAARLSDPKIPNPVAKPVGTTDYIVSVSNRGCVASDTIRVVVDTLFFPKLTTTDTTICQNYSVKLATNINKSTTYKWVPAAGLDKDNVSGPVATPNQTTTYTLTATSANKGCSQTATVKINVTPADVDITGDAYREICLGDTVRLNAVASPAGAAVTWAPPFYLNTATGPSVLATPDETVLITATYKINGCTVFDSVRLRVDSLPDLKLRLEKFKPIYCPGDTVFLLSKTYEPAGFPDIMHRWENFGTMLTPDSNWNMVILASETHLYKRATSNRGCVDTASILVPVGKIPDLKVTATPPQICVGGTSQLLALVDPPQKVKWEDMPPGLSCSECPNPRATPPVTSTYSVSTPDADCPANGSVTVEVLPQPTLNIPNNPSICRGQSVLLNAIPQGEPGVTYVWTSSPADPTLNANSPNPTVTPTQTTTYTIKAAGPQCSAERTVRVEVASATLSLGPDRTVCQGQQVTLNAAIAGTSGGTVSWFPVSQTGNSIPITPTSNITITATLLYGNNCFVRDTINLTVAPVPAVFLNDTAVCLGSSLVLNNRGGTVPGVRYEWTASSGTITQDAKPTVRPTQTATYTVKATLGTCTREESVVVTLRDDCLQVPNAFTPGGDKINEQFGLVEVEKGDYTLQTFAIYNRWGQKVFSTTTKGAKWDGTVDGKEAPSDVYAYYIVIEFGTGNDKISRVLKGDVTLLR